MIEETPRTQYGATAWGLLGETNSETSTAPFGEEEPAPPTRPSNPTMTDRSTSTPDAANGADLPLRSRHDPVQDALFVMKTPTSNPQQGGHLYDGLRSALHESQPGTLFGAPSARRTPPYPPLPVREDPPRGSQVISKGFLPVDAGLSSSARRLLEIPEPPFPPGQPSNAFQSGGSYSGSNGYGYGYYSVGFAAGLQSTSQTFQVGLGP